LALAAGVAVLLLALLGAVAQDRGGDGVALGIETISAALGRPLQGAGSAVPGLYAFLAGMAAAINPCGFAMLPGYLALYVGTEQPATAAVRRALVVSAVVASSFVLLFGAIGAALAVAGGLLTGLLPLLSLLTGILLVIAGARVLAGRSLYLAAGERVAGRLGSSLNRKGLDAYAAYGLAYGLTSLSCTLPLFLSVVGTSLLLPGFASGTAQFVLYALGMSAVLAAATLAVSLPGAPALARLRSAGRWLTPASGFVLLLGGGYIVYYWLTLGRLLG